MYLEPIFPSQLLIRCKDALIDFMQIILFAEIIWCLLKVFSCLLTSAHLCKTWFLLFVYSGGFPSGASGTKLGLVTCLRYTYTNTHIYFPTPRETDR